jgi:hypothetical protein
MGAFFSMLFGDGGGGGSYTDDGNSGSSSTTESTWDKARLKEYIRKYHELTGMHRAVRSLEDERANAALLKKFEEAGQFVTADTLLSEMSIAEKWMLEGRKKMKLYTYDFTGEKWYTKEQWDALSLLKRYGQVEESKYVIADKGYKQIEEWVGNNSSIQLAQDFAKQDFEEQDARYWRIWGTRKAIEWVLTHGTPGQKEKYNASRFLKTTLDDVWLDKVLDRLHATAAKSGWGGFNHMSRTWQTIAASARPAGWKYDAWLGTLQETVRDGIKASQRRAIADGVHDVENAVREDGQEADSKFIPLVFPALLEEQGQVHVKNDLAYYHATDEPLTQEDMALYGYDQDAAAQDGSGSDLNARDSAEFIITGSQPAQHNTHRRFVVKNSWVFWVAVVVLFAAVAMLVKEAFPGMTRGMPSLNLAGVLRTKVSPTKAIASA